MKTITRIFAVVLLLALTACPNSPRPEPRPAFVAEAQTVGASMLPTFGTNERVALELCKVSDLRVGDTVIYWHRQTNQFIHHRLMPRDPTTNLFRTRGDNNPGLDWGHFDPEGFVGRTHKLAPR